MRARTDDEREQEQRYCTVIDRIDDGKSMMQTHSNTKLPRKAHKTATQQHML
jgi:hypothetical protein